MKTKIIFLIVTLICSASAISAQKGTAANPAEAVLIEKERNAWKNLSTGNAEEFGKNLAEDYEGVNGETRHNKAQEIAAVKNTSFDRVVLSDIRVKWLSEDVAIVLSTFTITVVGANNKKESYSGKSYTIYAKRDKVWLCVFHTDEPIESVSNSNQQTAVLKP